MQKFIPQSFPNTGIKWFLALCFIFWISGAILLQQYSNDAILLWIHERNSPLQDSLMPVITRMGEFAYFILPVAIILILIPKHRKFKFFWLTIILCNAIPALINVSLKNIFAYHRPLHYFKDAAWFHQVAGQKQNFHLSFPSGHTEGAFAMMTFICLLLPKKWAGLSIFFFAAALATAYSRMYLGHHFFGDVLAGSMVGSIFCILTYAIIQKLTDKSDKTKLV